MYDTKYITGLIEEKIARTEIFIVEVSITGDNKINVIVDSENGIKIDDCIAISRQIESNLDREKEDFELEVSSAGIGSPFKIEKQYLINLNKNVEVLLKSGEKIKGTLKSHNSGSIALEYEKRVKIEGKKKKQVINEIKEIEIINIKSTKLILSL